MKSSLSPVFDASAVALSGLCLAHCLFLPVLAALLPMFSAWAEAEWVHLVFVAIAAPLTGWALWRAHRQHPLPLRLRGLAALGVLLLLVGALGWPSHDWETPLTVIGSFSLAAAHLWNWKRHRLAARRRAVSGDSDCHSPPAC